MRDTFHAIKASDYLKVGQAIEQDRVDAALVRMSRRKHIARLVAIASADKELTPLIVQVAKTLDPIHFGADVRPDTMAHGFQLVAYDRARKIIDIVRQDAGRNGIDDNSLSG